MKKCPFCAEKIQDEAIVCRYCGRDLPKPVAASTPSTTPRTPSEQLRIASAKAKRSVWATGAIWGAMFTALTVIALIIRYYNAPIELFGSLVGGTLVLSFLIWWLICTLIAWLWRKAGKKRIIKTVIIISIILLSTTLCVIVGILENPAPQLSPTPTPTSAVTKIQPINRSEFVAPTETSRPFFVTCSPPGNNHPRRNNNCIPANTPISQSTCFAGNTISISQVGQSLCVYGIVNEVQVVQQDLGAIVTNVSFSADYSRIHFTAITYGSYPDVHQGECIQATGLVSIENGTFTLWTDKFYYCR